MPAPVRPWRICDARVCRRAARPHGPGTADIWPARHGVRHRRDRTLTSAPSHQNRLRSSPASGHPQGPAPPAPPRTGRQSLYRCMHFRRPRDTAAHQQAEHSALLPRSRARRLQQQQHPKAPAPPHRPSAATRRSAHAGRCSPTSSCRSASSGATSGPALVAGSGRRRPPTDEQSTPSATGQPLRARELT